jgi:hypothetical protein
MIGTGLAVVALLFSFYSEQTSRVSSTSRVEDSKAATSEPDEPCRVEAPPVARAAAQMWCEGGIFTLVNVSTDATNFVVLLQFSKKGLRTWTSGKYAVLNQFRSITDEMVQKTDLNVAFSLHDPDGHMLGGCVRKRRDRESTCN